MPWNFSESSECVSNWGKPKSRRWNWSKWSCFAWEWQVFEFSVVWHNCLFIFRDFAIELLSGTNIVLHVKFEFNGEHSIVLNSLINGEWGPQLRHSHFLKRHDPFHVRIYVHEGYYNVCLVSVFTENYIISDNCEQWSIGWVWSSVPGRSSARNWNQRISRYWINCVQRIWVQNRVEKASCNCKWGRVWSIWYRDKRSISCSNWGNSTLLISYMYTINLLFLKKRIICFVSWINTHIKSFVINVIILVIRTWYNEIKSRNKTYMFGRSWARKLIVKTTKAM